MNFNPLAAVADALKVWPEEVSFPERLEGATPVELAEARSRLQQIGQAANELRRLVDRQLALDLTDEALRYGDYWYRPSGGKGDTYVKDENAWWETVIKGLQASPNPVGLVAALFPLKVKVSGLPMLAAALGEDADELRSQHIANEESTTPLSVLPQDKTAKFLQDMENGEVRRVKK